MVKDRSCEKWRSIIYSQGAQRNILHEISKRKANWIGHILCRNCLLQRVIEGKIQVRIEVTGRRGRRRRKLLDDLKERRGYSHLKEEALDRTMWTARFGRGFGPVVRQTTEWINGRASSDRHPGGSPGFKSLPNSEVLSDSSQRLGTNSGTQPIFRQRPYHFVPFPIKYSLIILRYIAWATDSVFKYACR
jgi:hypothetical protein